MDNIYIAISGSKFHVLFFFTQMATPIQLSLPAELFHWILGFVGEVKYPRSSMGHRN